MGARSIQLVLSHGCDWVWFRLACTLLEAILKGKRGEHRIQPAGVLQRRAKRGAATLNSGLTTRSHCLQRQHVNHKVVSISV